MTTTRFKNLSKIQAKKGLFSGKTVTNVDLNNVEFIDNDMTGTFDNSEGLESVTNINENVTNMTSLFEGSDFTYAPFNVPAGVINIDRMYANCENLTGDIYIVSTEVSHASDLFANTTAEKNLYIPFTYDGERHTVTYNVLYPIYGGQTVNGVTLIDSNANYKLTTYNRSPLVTNYNKEITYIDPMNFTGLTVSGLPDEDLSDDVDQYIVVDDGQGVYKVSIDDLKDYILDNA